MKPFVILSEQGKGASETLTGRAADIVALQLSASGKPA